MTLQLELGRRVLRCTSWEIWNTVWVFGHISVQENKAIYTKDHKGDIRNKSIQKYTVVHGLVAGFMCCRHFTHSGVADLSLQSRGLGRSRFLLRNQKGWTLELGWQEVTCSYYKIKGNQVESKCICRSKAFSPRMGNFLFQPQALLGFMRPTLSWQAGIFNVFKRCNGMAW